MPQPTPNVAREQRIPQETLSKFEKTNACDVPTIVDHLKDYARENPTNAALWCFGVGFVLGWRLKPW